MVEARREVKELCNHTHDEIDVFAVIDVMERDTCLIFTHATISHHDADEFGKERRMSRRMYGLCGEICMDRFKFAD